MKRLEDIQKEALLRWHKNEANYSDALKALIGTGMSIERATKLIERF